MTESLSLRATVALFARLKLRLIRNGFRSGGARAFATVLGWLGALLGGIAGFGLGLSMRSATPIDASLAITLLAPGLMVAALIVPVLLLGIDESISPDRLVLFPLPTGRRVLALGVAAGLAPMAFGLALALIGFVVGLVHSLVGAPFVVAAAVIFWATCVVASRVLPALLSGVMSSRRGRDAAVVIASLLGFSGFAAQFVVGHLRLSRSRATHFAAVARWTPPGALGRAMADAGRGRVLVAVGELAIGTAGLALLAALWGWSLASVERRAPGMGGAWSRRGQAQSEGHGHVRRRRSVSPSGSEQTAGRAAGVVGGAADAAAVSPTRWPASALGAVVHRELRYLTRDPRRRVAIVSVLVVGIVVPLVNIGNHPRSASSAVLLASGSAWLGILNAMNQLGMDGRALWFDLLSGIPPRRLFLGKNIAALASLLPIVACVSTVLAAVTGGWAYIPAALLMAVGTLCVGLGVANVASVLAPYPVPEGSNPFAMKTSGQGCTSFLLLFVAMAVMGAILAPVIGALIVWHLHPLRCVLVGALSIPYGAAWRHLGGALAAARLAGRGPEIMAMIDPNR